MVDWQLQSTASSARDLSPTIKSTGKPSLEVILTTLATVFPRVIVSKVRKVKKNKVN